MGGQRGRGGKTKKALIRCHLMLSKAVKNQTKRLSQFRLGIVLSLGRTLALFFFFHKWKMNYAKSQKV